uniref:Uncharacterized protein n=1 Tax=Aeromonas salmonicida subsp. salmonicida TaxID=29491 RepID=A0A1I9S1Z9_AERSS|nr:putative hypothetical protein [Aeromonas salmonicida subsp. salmonicida]
MPRAVAALQRVPARDPPPLRARPPDQVAHQVMTPVCRSARGLGHRPVAPHRIRSRTTRERLGLLASGVPRAVAALLLCSPLY